jgi:hypothetical protein
MLHRKKKEKEKVLHKHNMSFLQRYLSVTALLMLYGHLIVESTIAAKVSMKHLGKHSQEHSKPSFAAALSLQKHIPFLK